MTKREQRLEKALKTVRSWLRSMEYDGWAAYITKELKK